MSLFRRSKKAQATEIDPTTDEGIVGLFYSILGEIVDDFATAATDHLGRVHEPGGLAREKQRRDFMELGMDRSYLDALDDMEFTVDGAISVPQMGVRNRGTAVVVTRWTARGVHTRPLDGVEPTGEQVTIEGMNYTTFRNFNIRSEYTYWHVVEFTRRMVER